MKRRLKPMTFEQAYILYLKGMSLRQVAKVLGVAAQTVYNGFKGRHYQLRGAKFTMTPEEVAEAIKSDNDKFYERLMRTDPNNMKIDGVPVLHYIDLLNPKDNGEFKLMDADTMREIYEKLTFEERQKLGYYNYPSIEEDKDDPRDAGDLRINS